MSACTRHTIPPQIMRKPKPAAATKVLPVGLVDALGVIREQAFEGAHVHMIVP